MGRSALRWGADCLACGDLSVWDSTIPSRQGGTVCFGFYSPGRKHPRQLCDEAAFQNVQNLQALTVQMPQGQGRAQRHCVCPARVESGLPSPCRSRLQTRSSQQQQFSVKESSLLANDEHSPWEGEGADRPERQPV